MSNRTGQSAATGNDPRSTTEKSKKGGKIRSQLLHPPGEIKGHTSSPLAFSVADDPSELRCLKKNTNLMRVNKILKDVTLPTTNKVRKNRRMYRAGDYWLGPYLGSSPVNSVVQCLARKVGTDEFYTMKVLTIYEGEDETQDDRQGKMLLHTEHSLLSMLKDTPGVIGMHALFQDYAFDCVRRCSPMRPSHVKASVSMRKKNQTQRQRSQNVGSLKKIPSFRPSNERSSSQRRQSSASTSRAAPANSATIRPASASTATPNLTATLPSEPTSSADDGSVSTFQPTATLPSLSTSSTFVAAAAVPATSTVSSVFALPPPPPPRRRRGNFSSSRTRGNINSSRQANTLPRYVTIPRQSGRRYHRRLQSTESQGLRAREALRHRRIVEDSRRTRASTSSHRSSSSTRNSGEGRRFIPRFLGIGHRGRFGPIDDFLYDAADVSDPRDLDCLYTGRIVRRLCLVLDCVTPHEFSNKTDHLMNLQHYVIARQALPELEALTILYHTAAVVHSIHEKNIVHRDLKLGNLVVERGSGRVILTNLCLGQFLMPGCPKLQDQRGSPAYISPDVLSAQPYRGKPSDMWSLGVVLFTMLYGHFPFYDKVPHELFKKIKAAKYIIPRNDNVKGDTVDLIHCLLEVKPSVRYTSGQLLARLSASIPARLALESRRVTPHVFQIVPDLDDRLKDALKRCASPPGPLSLVSPDATPSPSILPMSGPSSFSASSSLPPSVTSDSGEGGASSTTSASGSSSSTLSSPFDRERPQQRLHQQLQQLQIIPPNRLFLSSPNPDGMQEVPEVRIHSSISRILVAPGTVNSNGQNSGSSLPSSVTSNTFLPSLFSSRGGSSFSPLFRTSGSNSGIGASAPSLTVSAAPPVYQAVPSADLHSGSLSDFSVPATRSPFVSESPSLYSLSPLADVAVMDIYTDADATSSAGIVSSVGSSGVWTTGVSSRLLDSSPLASPNSSFTFNFNAATTAARRNPPFTARRNVHASRRGGITSTTSRRGGVTPTTSRRNALTTTSSVLRSSELRWSSPCSSGRTRTVAARSSPSTTAAVQTRSLEGTSSSNDSELDSLIHRMKQERQLRGNNSIGNSSGSGPSMRDPQLPPMAPLSTASRSGSSLIPHSYGEITALTPDQLLALRDLLPPLPEFSSASRPRAVVATGTSFNNISQAPPTSTTDPLNMNPLWHRLGINRLAPSLRTPFFFSSLARPHASWSSSSSTEGLSRLVLSRQQPQQGQSSSNSASSTSTSTQTSSDGATPPTDGVPSEINPQSNVVQSSVHVQHGSDAVQAPTYSVQLPFSSGESSCTFAQVSSNTIQTSSSSALSSVITNSTTSLTPVLSLQTSSPASPSFRASSLLTTDSASMTGHQQTSEDVAREVSGFPGGSGTTSSGACMSSATSSTSMSETLSNVNTESPGSSVSSSASASLPSMSGLSSMYRTTPRRSRARRTNSSAPYHVNLRPRRGSIQGSTSPQRGTTQPLMSPRHRRSTRSSSRPPTHVFMSSDDDSMEELSPPTRPDSRQRVSFDPLAEDASSSSSSD
ncbi:serine-rich adhesin for platelets [Hyalella azteca]|uniref:Serine/threonine-protein kinase 40 n=1 Tax=Hyalella azteca TaxID=294128 RepID=A0A8B7P3I5_HYAAZ|nr:serine-rich adhesin for platelets [Hyalella azteca]XP_018020572.1 serine-rich adhesin for platelets [Hyalella azteca]XP_047739442.1 serine-rich adhesin for platelets [Hyalella azteca]